MIAIGLRFLLGRIVATHPADRERAEWPLHPDRVFMALVAAWGTSDRMSEESESLRWLESLGAPEIIASQEIEDTQSEVTRREVVTCYVPVNDTELSTRSSNKAPSDAQIAAGLGLLPEKRLRQARHFPTITPKNECMLLRWPKAEANGHAEALARLCRKVTYIGHSSSPVQCWLVTDTANLPPATLIPTPNHIGGLRLRVTSKGRLDELMARFAAGLRPSPSQWAAYAPPRPMESNLPQFKTCFDPRLLILRQTSGPRFGLASTLLLTRTLRDTIMSRYTEIHKTPVPEWISGHALGGQRSEMDHLAFVPLPHVGFEHADGHLLGLALVVPRNVQDKEVDSAFRGILFSVNECAEPIEIRLTLGKVGSLALELDNRPKRPVALQSEIWTAEMEKVSARRWATVTPIAFDRHPKSRDPWDEIEQAIRSATSRIGVGDALTSVTLSPVSLFMGSPTNRGFPNLQRKSGGNIHHTHAILTFRESIIGPLLLGAGRYRGYGLCRPLRNEEVGV
jgi:CRISPR-associated protein Csb2